MNLINNEHWMNRFAFFTCAYWHIRIHVITAHDRNKQQGHNLLDGHFDVGCRTVGILKLAKIELREHSNIRTKTKRIRLIITINKGHHRREAQRGERKVEGIAVSETKNRKVTKVIYLTRVRLKFAPRWVKIALVCAISAIGKRHAALAASLRFSTLALRWSTL